MRSFALLLLAGCTFPWGEQEIDALEVLGRADRLFAEGDCAAAVPLYEEALAARPRMVEVYEKLWRCHTALGDRSRAVEALERGVRVCGRHELLTVPLDREHAHSKNP